MAKKPKKTPLFASPQKLDPPPPSLKAARKVAAAAMVNSNDKNGAS